MSDSPTWNDGLMSALLNPGVGALAGAAQGFAQAAMPSRLPVPTGAALGMGMGGALQGAQNAERGQLAAQQIKAAEMQNQVTASGLPLALARNKMLANIWQNPDQMQQMMGNAPASPDASSAAPAPPQSSPPLIKNALSSLPDDATRTLAINAALRAGLPQEAWPAWIASLHTESGWNLKAPDNPATNGSFDIGPGQVNSRTARTLGYTPEELRDPATNLLASAKYFGQQWTAGGGDPTKAMAGYHTGDPTKSDPDYVAKGMSRLGNWGYANGPNVQTGPQGGPVTPSSALATAQTYINQANQLERQQQVAKFWQSQGMPVMPPPGDPAVLRAQAQKYTDLALAGPTAAAQASAKAPFDIRTDRFGNVWQTDTSGQVHWIGRGSEVRPIAQDGKIVLGDVGGAGIGKLPPGAAGTPPEAPNALEAAINARNKVLTSEGIAPSLGAPPVPAPPAVTPPVRVPVPAPPAAAPAVTPPPAVQQDIQHIAPGVTARSVPGGTAYTNTRKIQDSQYETDMKDLSEATDEATGIQGNMARLYEMRDLVDRLPQMGSGGQFRAGLANIAETYIKPIPGIGSAADDFIHKAADLPDASAAQQFAKLSLQAAGLQEKSTVGARGSLGLTRLFLQANPNIDLQPDAGKTMANFLLVQHQMELDYLRGLHDHVVNAGQAYTGGQADYVPAATFDKNWISQNNEKTYVAATNALSGRPFEDWSKLLSNPADIKATLGIVQRIDPNAQVMWSDGKRHPFEPAAQGTANAP